ncbi:syndecan 4-A-like isoform X1 [Mixophyes fleayi]|uniref:syndecan 4-A-like isoform X1 n=1 Tax=Mixophyes fleayi TaxID=3061075 RepID=UPI003F4DE173
MNRVLFVLGLLLSAAVAESIRETETMDPNRMLDGLIESSGSLPDDEDLEEPDYFDDLDSDSLEDSDSFDEGSGSGDSEEMDDLESTVDTPTTAMGNKIPENDLIDPKVKIVDVFQIDNEIMVGKKIPEVEQSNEISMASTSHSFFSRIEVVVALVAGTVVGLLFAVFIIVFVVMRKKKDIAYDTVKKPIYKKASTMEV